MREGYIAARRVIANQMIPPSRERANQRVVRQPFELVQFQPRCGVDVCRSQAPAQRVIEQHDAGPVLLFVCCLLSSQEFARFDRTMIVLDHLHRVLGIPHRPKPGDIAGHQHVAIHEYAPAFVRGQIWSEKPGKRKIGGLKRVPDAGQHPAQLRQHYRRDGHRHGTAPRDAVGEHAECDRFTGVKSDEYPYHFFHL